MSASSGEGGSPGGGAEAPPADDEVLSASAPSWLDGPFLARALGVPQVTEWEASPANARGENYASVVYKCTARAAGKGGEEEEEHRVIVKCLPSNALRQMYSNKAEIFRKEQDMYRKILPRYEAMLFKASGRSSFPWPTHYVSMVDGKKDYIVLKDLGPQGFSMAKRMKGLDADHLALVLAALGEFHACSVAFKALAPAEEFEAEVAGPFRDLMYTEDNGDMMKWVVRSVETAGATVRSWGEGFERIGQWITEWGQRVHDDTVALVRPGRGALLCHGDVWLNNMLFRYQHSEGGKPRPAEVKLLDFQIGRYSSPATDLLYLMVTSTTAVTRRQHWAHLLEQEYLKNFWKTLESLGVKETMMGDLYSIDWLRKEMKRFGLWALLNAVIVLRVILLESKDAPDLDTLSEEDINSEKDFFQGSDDTVYQERLRGLISEFSDDGLFDA